MSEITAHEVTDTPTYGVELERTFTTVCGYPHAVGDDYFAELQQRKQSRGETTRLKRIGDTTVGVYTPNGEEALDNAFTLGESATGPVSETSGGLNRLHEIVSLSYAMSSARWH